tara:strand:- start:626 stop:883 length:258 start_codon:yes stop_codon:yes gene_type:complete
MTFTKKVVYKFVCEDGTEFTDEKEANKYCDDANMYNKISKAFDTFADGFDQHEATYQWDGNERDMVKMFKEEFIEFVLELEIEKC